MNENSGHGSCGNCGGCVGVARCHRDEGSGSRQPDAGATLDRVPLTANPISTVFGKCSTPRTGTSSRMPPKREFRRGKGWSRAEPFPINRRRWRREGKTTRSEPLPIRSRGVTSRESRASRYMPLPFEIVQTPKYVTVAYEFAHARRIIYTDGSPHVEALEFWMGDSRGRWEGDTLVVDSNNFNDKTWFDKSGNYHSDELHVVERYTPIDPATSTTR